MTLSLFAKARLGRIAALETRGKALNKNENPDRIACECQPCQTPARPVRVARYRIGRVPAMALGLE